MFVFSNFYLKIKLESNERIKLNYNHQHDNTNITIDPNQIASICYEAYKKLGKSGKPNYNKNEFTIFAGIVEYDKQNIRTPQVVCLTTGTKCFPKNIPYRLEDIIDCHAESLLKRAFKLYLIDLINNWLKTTKQIHSSDHFYEENIKNRSYCLFISQAPCGSFKRWKGDVAYNNLENELKIYKVIGVNRKPGRGELCPKAACIHKIAKWQIFGLQGCQLFYITRRPLTFDHIIIGNCEDVNFESNLIEDRLQIDYKEYSLIKNELKGEFQFFQSTPVHFANQFRMKEFIRNKVPCGSSIVAWRESNELNLKCEILANGRRLGAFKRKLCSNEKISNLKCDMGSSKVSDFFLNQHIKELTNKFNQIFLVNIESNRFNIKEIYQHNWEIARKNFSIFRGWPIIQNYFT